MPGHILFAAVLLGAGAAHAAPIGFSLEIGGGANNPTFTITNTSAGALLTGGTISIGDTAFNFDCVENVTAPAGGSLDFGALEVGTCFPGGGARPDEIAFTATDFDPGETASFRTDIDPDFADGGVSDLDILLDGGGFLAVFAGPGTGTTELGASFSSGVTRYEAAASAVPLPGTLPLALAGLGALVALSRRG